MNTKTIQTRNVSTTVFQMAEKRATTDGLSSVQDAVRIFLAKYAQGEITIGFHHDISSQTEQQYLKDSQDVEQQVKKDIVKPYSNANDLLTALKNESSLIIDGKNNFSIWMVERIW